MPETIERIMNMKTSSLYPTDRFNVSNPAGRKPLCNGPKASNRAALGLASVFSVLLLLASQASAASFSFSTGDPDGKIGTLSRPPSPGKLQTETADDFIIVSNTTLISQASFKGL